MSIAVIVIISLRFSISKEDLEGRYQDKAHSAFQAKDYPLSLVCYERLATMGLERPENLFEMGTAQGVVLKDPSKTLKIMKRLKNLRLGSDLTI